MPSVLSLCGNISLSTYVDVVNVWLKSLYSFGNTGIPSTVIDSRIQVIHARRVWFSFCLLSEDRCIQKNISDVVELMILHLNFVWISEDGHNHRLSNLVDWILNATATRNDP
jgi:hypothetical protein